MIGREKAMQDPRFGDPRWSPAGFVFIATDRDIDEQLKTLLFGYPQSGWGIVKKIVKGTPIFLFDLHHQVGGLHKKTRSLAIILLANVSKGCINHRKEQALMEAVKYQNTLF